jgi:peptide/nickel transport system ATP-binding protein
MDTVKPLLRVSNLCIQVGNEGPLAVDHLSFDMAPGEIVALVGESGSGKTMAARAVIGLLPAPMRVSSGRLLFGDIDLASLDYEGLRRVRGAKIGMVFQEPMVSLNPTLTIGQQMAEGMRLHTDLDDKTIRTRSLEMLRRIGIDDPERCLKAFPHEFSGGMRQRIMLASVMLLRPALLIADEPTTALDTLAQADVIALMLELTREEGTAVLFISHDLSLVVRHAHKVVVMRQGKAVESGPTQQILLGPKADYTRQLLDALPTRGELSAAPLDSPLVDMRNVTIDHPGRQGFLTRGKAKRAVDGINLQIGAGETVALVGGSGSGKTTLGRSVVGLIKPISGEIFFDGVDILKSGNREHRLQCQMIFQDPVSSLDPRARIADILVEPLRHVPGLSSTERAERVRQILKDIGLDELFAERFPHQLSGGQRQRVAIGRALIRKPKLVIADEPISALDMTIQKQVLELFERLQQQYGFACLFISHDLAAVERIAHRVAVMERGRLVEIGTTEAVFDRPQHAFTRRLLAAANPLQRLADGSYQLRSSAVV